MNCAGIRMMGLVYRREWVQKARSPPELNPDPFAHETYTRVIYAQSSLLSTNPLITSTRLYAFHRQREKCYLSGAKTAIVRQLSVRYGVQFSTGVQVSTVYVDGDTSPPTVHGRN